MHHQNSATSVAPLATTMDWHSWLSRTGLEPFLVREYSLTFTRNELQREDIAHFNHEFLQSMGISVAKHRLEMLKLAKKDVGPTPRSFSGLVRKLFTKKRSFQKDAAHLPVSKLSPYRLQWNGELHKRMVASRSTMTLSESDGQQKCNVSHGGLSPCRSQWNREPQKHMVASRSMMMRSGPLDMRRQEKYVVPNRSLSVSGPLDGKMQENLMMSNWSPSVSRPIDRRMKGKLVLSGPLDREVGLSPKPKNPSDNVNLKEEVQSLWSLMFQDLKPT